jgi:hypothetical protein
MAGQSAATAANAALSPLQAMFMLLGQEKK